MNRLYLLVLFFVLVPVLCQAQEYKHIPLDTEPGIKVHKKAPKQEVHITFPNLNKLPYYHDERKLAAIQKLEKKRRNNE